MGQPKSTDCRRGAAEGAWYLGNYYLDKATGRELMIADPSLVSSGTVVVAHLGRDQLSSNSA